MNSFKFASVLLLYKKSAYELYIRKLPLRTLKDPRVILQIERFKKAHKKHYESLQLVEEALKEKKIPYRKRSRGGKVLYSKSELVITVGGDGTFLEAARNLTTQAILGVNSDPGWSVGQFCAVDTKKFSIQLNKIMANKYQIKRVQRLEFKIPSAKKTILVLNELLVSHKNPAAMSHYTLVVNGQIEEQRSSGIWIATAAGSTGALKSAGGKVMPIEKNEVQYRPRELHQRKNVTFVLKGGVVKLGKPFEIISLMKQGMVYVDGAHYRLPFPFGSKIAIKASKYPLNIIKG